MCGVGNLKGVPEIRWVPYSPTKLAALGLETIGGSEGCHP